VLSFRFSSELQSQAMFEHAFFASWRRVPQLSQIEIQGDLLLVRPGIKGTGTVHIPMVHPRYGVMLRSTETLMQRSRPYLLLKELGRGELACILRLLHEWKTFGFIPSEALGREIHDLVHSFGIMATSDETLPATGRTALELFQRLDAMGMHLVDQYFEQVVEALQKKQSPLPPLGIFLDRNVAEESFEKFHSVLNNKLVRPVFDEAFQSVAAPPSWKSVERLPGKFHWEPVDRYFKFVEQLGKKLVVGPILSFKPDSVPQWVREKIDSHETFEEAAVRYTVEFAKRYARQGSHWIIAADFFSSPECGFSIGRGVALICDLIREVKYTIRDKDLLVTVDQPCGDYYRTNDCPLPFIAIVESLASVRSLDGFLLDLKLGMEPQETLPRNPMLLSRLLDQWGIWGKKLFVSLSVPSQWSILDDSQKQVQSEWARQLTLTCLAKQNVHGIFWNPLLDVSGKQSTGLIGIDGQIKLTFHQIASLRKLRPC